MYPGEGAGANDGIICIITSSLICGYFIENYAVPVLN